MRGGFTAAYNVVLFDRDLTPHARLLYFQLQHYGFILAHAGAESPQQEEIAANLGIKERALRPYIRELEAALLLRTEQRGRGLSNVYVILEPHPDRQKTAGQERQDSAAKTGSKVPLLNSVEEVNTLSKESAQNSIYEALVAACFPKGATLTKREKQQTALAAANIASGAGTAELVPKVLRAYQASVGFRECVVTPMALSSNWSKLAPVGTTTVCEDCGTGRGFHAPDCERIQP